ncbi:acyl-CoA dehydrogenase family member 11-like, partial [Notechis scutatus]|uniref:Acyl-CoA dehydrogenase family member 11-like n=1 Tax=Notechis scutatus TaxID=8663 RepID=A0A6J1VYS2_9SAUR
AEESLVAEGYTRRYSSWSRVYQIAKLYLFMPICACYGCPLAMTDGAVKVIESLGIPKPLEEAYAHLTSSDPKTFWISGQWMTERKGGSDVGGGTETVARELPDGSYSLHGFKWFTSAADSDMTLTLARIVGPDGQIQQGSRGLSLFYLKTYEDGKLNGIKIQRLKEKLGTRALPTAELLLDGARAHLISAEGMGMACIANTLNITRIYNTIFAGHHMRRIVDLARDYATKREAFGKPLKDHPLHMQTLARMEVIRCVCSGGSLQTKLEAATQQSELQASVQIIQNNLQKLKQFVRRMDSKGEAGWQLAARDFSYTLAWTYEGVLLLEHAARAGASDTNIYAAQRWCQEGVCLVDREEKAGSYNSEAVSLDKSLVYDGYSSLRGKL